MNKDVILVWFRNDLRVHDNEILWKALQRADKVVPVYLFDPRQFTELPNGLHKTGIIRAKFLLESVEALRNALRERGGDLLVLSGKPEEILPQLAERYQVKEVYHHREVAEEETRISSLVEEALWRKRLNLKHFIGHTLYHKEDLPFPIKDIPDAFATFRKKVERETEIRAMIQTPDRIVVPDEFEAYELPSLTALGYTEEELLHAQSSPFEGGEQTGKEQLDAIVAGEITALASVGNSHDGGILSPWIALGCLSPHTVYHTVKQHEAIGTLSKKMASNLILGLLWRDYFRFMFKKHGNRFFLPNGFSDDPHTGSTSPNSLAFTQWKEGKTGDSFVDAAMHQLNEIGFIPHAARLLVAHFLVSELGVNHLLGAAYFEEKLIDYSPASNYGNWAHIAGVGSSKKDNGLRDLGKLQALIDPNGDYVRRWNSKQVSYAE